MQLTITQLTDLLVTSYARAGGINHLDGKNLPSKRAISLITMDLLRLLFPGFFDEKLVHSSEIKQATTGLLEAVLTSLEREIRKSLEYNPPPELQHAKKDLGPIARDFTVEFLNRLPRIREMSDAGTPVMVESPDGPEAKAFQAIAEKVAAALKTADRPAPKIIIE